MSALTLPDKLLPDIHLASPCPVSWDAMPCVRLYRRVDGTVLTRAGLAGREPSLGRRREQT